MRPPETATVERLTVYPIKSLDGRSVEAVEIIEDGGLAGDREYALVDADGEYVNGKGERRVHPIEATYDGDGAHAESVTLSTPTGEIRRFDLTSDATMGEEAGKMADIETVDTETADTLAGWLAEWFGYPVSLERDRAGGFPDDTTASGPTLISTATIETVASWFEGITPEGMRRRLRANVEVGGVPAFWEDRLFADRAHRVAFTVGGVRFLGHNPCQRCVVPTRDPDTGQEYEGFRSTFLEKRRETMPAWSGGDWFDHDFRLMVNTSVPDAGWGETLRVGDEVVVEETVAHEETTD